MSSGVLEEMVGLRKGLQLTQQQLAEIIGVKQAYISLLEKGRRKPNYGVLCKLSEVLQPSRYIIFTDARTKEQRTFRVLHETRVIRGGRLYECLEVEGAPPIVVATGRRV